MWSLAKGCAAPLAAGSETWGHILGGSPPPPRLSILTTIRTSPGCSFYQHSSPSMWSPPQTKPAAQGRPHTPRPPPGRPPPPRPGPPRRPGGGMQPQGAKARAQRLSDQPHSLGDPHPGINSRAWRPSPNPNMRTCPEVSPGAFPRRETAHEFWGARLAVARTPAPAIVLVSPAGDSPIPPPLAAHAAGPSLSASRGEKKEGCARGAADHRQTLRFPTDLSSRETKLLSGRAQPGPGSAILGLPPGPRATPSRPPGPPGPTPEAEGPQAQDPPACPFLATPPRPPCSPLASTLLTPRRPPPSSISAPRLAHQPQPRLAPPAPTSFPPSSDPPSASFPPRTRVSTCPSCQT